MHMHLSNIARYLRPPVRDEGALQQQYQSRGNYTMKYVQYENMDVDGAQHLVSKNGWYRLYDTL